MCVYIYIYVYIYGLSNIGGLVPRVEIYLRNDAEVYRELDDSTRYEWKGRAPRYEHDGLEEVAQHPGGHKFEAQAGARFVLEIAIELWHSEGRLQAQGHVAEYLGDSAGVDELQVEKDYIGEEDDGGQRQGRVVSEIAGLPEGIV